MTAPLKPAFGADMTQAELEDLILILDGFNINVRSPYERMLEEEARAAAEASAATEATPAAQPVENTPAPPEEATPVSVPVENTPAPPEEASPVAAPIEDSPAQNTDSAMANGPPRLTRELVARALLSLGYDVDAPVNTAAVGTPAPNGGSVMQGGSSSSGGGGTAVASSAATVPAAAQPVAKGKGVAPAVASCSSGGRGDMGPLVANANSTGFFCSGCGQWNARPVSNTYYVVTVGRDVGVFTDWHVVSPLVTGVSGAVFRRYNSLEVAQAIFAEALAEGRVRTIV